MKNLLNLQLIQRFYSKVNKTSHCWLWIAHRDKDGYGIFSIKHQNQRAHRIAYKILYGSIPKGMLVLHRCDNSRCVNPSHLSLGTAKDNHDDMKVKGRGLSGEKHPNRKLSHKKVVEIRKLWNNGAYVQREIADMFGITQANVSSIIRNKSWITNGIC